MKGRNPVRREQTPLERAAGLPAALPRPGNTSCFRCDGTRLLCDICGESEAACKCKPGGMFAPCDDCGGTGK